MTGMETQAGYNYHALARHFVYNNVDVISHTKCTTVTECRVVVFLISESACALYSCFEAEGMYI